MAHSRRTFVIAALALAGALLVWAVRYLAPTEAIEIVDAEYGVPGRTCSAGPQIKKHVSEACEGFRPRCLVSVSNGWCGDPAAGVVKTLTVKYRCGETLKRVSAAEGTGLLLTCP
jgi:hypothetical protein